MKKIVIFLILSIVLSLIVLIFGVWFIANNITIVNMIILAVLIVLLLVLYSYCFKIILLPEGYTVFQAAAFHKECKRNKIDTFYDIKKKRETMRNILNKNNINIDFSDKNLWKVYCDGKDFYSALGIEFK